MLAAVLCLAAHCLAQGIGIGSGLDDVRMVGKAVALTPCAMNLNFAGSDATGCHFYAVSAFR